MNIEKNRFLSFTQRFSGVLTVAGLLSVGLLISAMVLTSCQTIKYKDLDINVRKVEQVDSNGDVSIFYQKYDAETGCYYEAEMREDGKYYLTEKSVELQQRRCLHELTEDS